jgi:hypothetical protein
MRAIFLIPPPKGEGGEQSEPGGGILKLNPTPGAARRTLPLQGRDKKMGSPS